jgi:PBSX family phage terminase large subunit
MSCGELAKHAYMTENGRAVVVANTLQQVNEAVMPELRKFLPPWFVVKETKSPIYIKLKNGFEFLFYASDDQNKLRSLNLTAFYIEEASGVDYAIFDQLQTRLRNKAAYIWKDGRVVGYNFVGILSTNPESGWIVEDFLLKSGEISASKSIDMSKYDNFLERTRDKHYHTFLSSTRDNIMLDADYISRASAGKPAWWIAKYIDCALDVREGAVYKDFGKYIIEPFEIPKDWKRIFGYDPGYRDPTAFVQAAINPLNGNIYVYDVYYEVERPVSHHAQQVRELTRGLTLFKKIQADPSVEKRNDDGRSYRQYFKALSDIDLEVANNDILYGIEKTRNYLESGKLFIFNNCDPIKKEAMNYVWADRTSGKGDLPLDKHNHALDALRYMIAKMPENPNQVYEMVRQNQILRTYSPFSGGGGDSTSGYKAISRFKPASRRD